MSQIPLFRAAWLSQRSKFVPFRIYLAAVPYFNYYPPPNFTAFPDARRASCIDLMDYHLKPIGKTCASTGNDLIPGSICHSILVERDGVLVRLDFSEEGWEPPPEEIIGHWQSIVSEPSDDKPAPLDTDALMQYFEQLDEDANPAQDKFRYILALLLMQKRKLKLEGSRIDGDIEYLQLVGNRGEGSFEVRDQQLSDEEIQQLQSSLNTHLTTEWS